MKKKIAVVFGTMIVGGAEKACINFLKAIDKSRYEVYLFTRVANNPYIAQIPSHIEVCDIGKIDTKQLLMDEIQKLQFVRVVKNLTNRVLCRLSGREYSQLAYACKSYLLSDVEFDCAIAYKANYPDTAMTLYSIRAKKKAAIVHSAWSSEHRVDNEFKNHIVRFDKVYCVSSALRCNASQIYPSLTDKLEVMYNVMNLCDIITKAQETIEPLKRISVVTVGRLSAEKGQQMVPVAVRLLIDAGYDVNWYLVGDGPLRAEVEQMAQKYRVADRVILLGTKENPYPYIKNCDIYVQPSFTEGYCTTTMEAKILCKPIVTTDAPGMREQFVSGENGLIVDSMTPEALAQGIITLLDYPEIMEKFQNALKKESYDTTKELQKLYDLMES